MSLRFFSLKMMLRADPLGHFLGNSVISKEQKGLVGSLFIQLYTLLSAGESKPSPHSKLSLSLVSRRCHLLDWLKDYAVLFIYFDNEEVGIFFSKMFP